MQEPSIGGLVHDLVGLVYGLCYVRSEAPALGRSPESGPIRLCCDEPIRTYVLLYRGPQRDASRLGGLVLLPAQEGEH